ncbi:IucA/IucC family protein [Actinomadura craniellae]|uniref:IucA/IucC family protein n=1 Tax=Actinomadura craniellae TaxID=2231787 RepID=UPI0018F174AA|nr:IucA/IucC family protein [Actinomadura craniellae]
MLLTRTTFTAADATASALLNCLVREVCAPEHQVRAAGDRVLLGLPRVGVTLRARLVRPPYRAAPPVEERRGDAWLPVGWRRLADLVAGELELATGHANPEFPGQVDASHTALAAILAARPAGDDLEPVSYLGSEQALVAGHRYHPAPKARQGAPADWLAYSPEVGARFPLRLLAVRTGLVVEEGDAGALDGLPGGPVPPGYRALPAHPWQLALLADRPLLRRALADGSVLDLGPAGPEAVPTASVRTVYVPGADLFCKFSLDVRITNCVRKNAWYELSGAVALDRLLRPVAAALAGLFGGCALLAEPGYRSVALADRRLHEGLGVILRQGVGGLAGTPLVAGALADPYGSSPAALARLPAVAEPDDALRWWDAYVGLVAPPVLHAYLAHGVVLEPHLQNVLVAVDGSGTPVQAIFRDLEGTKLVTGRWALDGLPERVRESVRYDAERGWRRVVYCLVVNHLAEIAAALADRHPGLERALWRAARERLARYAAEHPPAAPTDAARLRALLAGVPLPAKANLRARWARSADRAAGYVPVPNPLRED